jgi:hypothetical protein
VTPRRRPARILTTPEQVAVTLHTPPGEDGPQTAVGWIEDTPEARAQLEEAAIPRCREWRMANPEPRTTPREHPDDPLFEPAPYCCSAYCDRCNGLRALNDDDPPLRPNEWMFQ